MAENEAMEREITYNADHWVSRYEIESRQGYERELAAQRLKIANLEAEKISDAKDIEVYKQVKSDIKEAVGPLWHEVECLKAKAAAQDVWNTAQKAAMHSMRGDIDDLLRLTRRYIPRRYIMPPIEDPVEP